MRHAVLVMAHGNLYVLKRCIEILDDPRIDFYIHVDKKSDDDGCWLKEHVKCSEIHFTDRIPVYWGHHSQTEAGALLLREAVNSGKDYQYYHLISAVDMPLKTPEEIDAFFEANAGTEFVRFWRGTKLNTEYNWRMAYRYPMLKRLKRVKSKRLNDLQKMLYSRIVRLPRKKGTNIVRDKGWNVYAGDLWWSITDSLAKEIVAMEQQMLPYWKDCYVSDETYVQTLLRNASARISYQSNFETRHIDWDRGKPYVFQASDYDELMKTEAVFARKFNPDDCEIVDTVYSTLMQRKAEQS